MKKIMKKDKNIEFHINQIQALIEDIYKSKWEHTKEYYEILWSQCNLIVKNIKQILWFTDDKKDETIREPITWNELKELCRATNYIQDILKKNRKESNIPVHFNDCGTGYVIIKDLYFGENGIIFYEVKEQRYIIAKDLTYTQMWGIIKNLVGEK